MVRPRTVTRSIDSLTAQERAACLRLNMGPRGLMRQKFLQLERDIQDHPRRSNWGNAVIHYNENREIDGWALVWKNKYSPKKDAYFYVRVKDRRKGVGSKLMINAKKIDENVRTYPWDRRSRNFFNKFNQPNFRS